MVILFIQEGVHKAPNLPVKVPPITGNTIYTIICIINNQMKKTNSQSVKQIKFKDAIKMVPVWDREAFQEQFGNMKKIPEYLIRDWM